MMKIDEVRTRAKAACEVNPQTELELTDDLLVKVRSANGHTVQYDSLTFLERMEQFCASIRTRLETPS